MTAMPATPDAPARYATAAALLDRAALAGGNDPTVLYMLAMAHKRQGKLADARAALRKIAQPDAGVLLQLALLSLEENNLPQAEAELLRAWEMDPSSYEICYNLLLTQLTLGKTDACLALIPPAIELVRRRGDSPPAAEERRFLQVLQLLVQAAGSEDDPRAADALAELSAADEQRLLKIIRSLGRLDTVHRLLEVLVGARPRSAAVRDAHVEAVLVKAKDLFDRCAWFDAELLLRPLAGEKTTTSRAHQLAVHNLLGCCCCLTQDFTGAISSFRAAARLAGGDARLHQNVALACELLGELDMAEPHWNRYLDLLDEQLPVPPDRPHYREALLYESLNRLAGRYAEKEKWTTALAYVQRAQELRPDEPDVLERLFHLYTHAKKPHEARRTLEELRRMRPREPQYELYELDLVDIKGLGDIDRLLTEVERIRRNYPDDARVAERAVTMVANVIPLMGSLCDRLTDQMSKVIDQVRNLPSYQIDWPAVRDVMRDLLREFQKLRRITGKCLPLVSSDEHRRIIRDLADHIDRKMEACRSMGA
jgi:tetratricopeptide (TPR) repeat protein